MLSLFYSALVTMAKDSLSLSLMAPSLWQAHWLCHWMTNRTLVLLKTLSPVIAGELEAETLALLEMEAVSSADFSPEVLACLPQDLPWSISPQDRTYRRDFTGIRCLPYSHSPACCFAHCLSCCAPSVCFADRPSHLLSLPMRLVLSICLSCTPESPILPSHAFSLPTISFSSFSVVPAFP